MFLFFLFLFFLISQNSSLVFGACDGETALISYYQYSCEKTCDDFENCDYSCDRSYWLVTNAFGCVQKNCKCINEVVFYDSTCTATSNGCSIGDVPDTRTCAPKPCTTINGSCGSADGGTFSTTPTSGLCSRGTATTVKFNAVRYTGSAYTNKSTCASLGGQCGQFANGSSPDSGTTCKVTGYVDYGKVVTGKCDGDADVRCCVPATPPNTYTWTCEGSCCGSDDNCLAYRGCDPAQSCPTDCHTNTYTVPDGNCGTTTCWANAPAAQTCPTTCHTNTYTVPDGNCGTTTCWANAPAYVACPTTCHTDTQYLSDGNCGTHTCLPIVQNLGACGAAINQPWSYEPPAGTLCGVNNSLVGWVTTNEGTYTWQCKGNDVQSCIGSTVSCSTNRNRYPWLQVSGGSLISNGSFNNAIPGTCVLPGCNPNSLVDKVSGDSSRGMIVAGGSVLANSNITSNTDESRIVRNKSIAKMTYDYDYFYQHYFVNRGVGTTFSESDKDNWNWSTIKNSLGSDRIVLIDGSLTIDEAISTTSFLMVVAKDNIVINASATPINAVLVANTVSVSGTVNNQLVINGIVMAKGNVALTGYTDMSKNNTSPAIKVNYQPGLLFGLPDKVNKRVTRWRAN